MTITLAKVKWMDMKDHACDDNENSGSDQMICKNPNTAEEEVITSIVLSKSPAIGPKPIVPKKPDVPLKPKIIGPKPTNLYLSKDSHSNPIYHDEAEKEVSPMRTFTRTVHFSDRSSNSALLYV